MMMLVTAGAILALSGKSGSELNGHQNVGNLVGTGKTLVGSVDIYKESCCN